MPSYSAGSATVQIVPDFSGAQRKIGQWFSQQGDMNLGVNANLNRSSLQAVQTQIHAADSEINVDINIKNIERKVATFLDQATGFSMVEEQFKRLFGPRSILLTSGVGAITALASSVSTALPVIGLLPAAIMGAAGPLAALAIGTRGVGEAFKALGAADKSSAATATASAAARKAAAAQVESAQKGVESAQRGVETAARSMEMAERGVADAERGVLQAQQATAKAQDELNDARDKAVRNLQDMNLELARAALNEEGATLAVEEAQQRLNEALGGNEQALQRQWDASIALQRAQLALAQIQDDPRKTALDREAALGAVTQAQLALNEATYDATTARELDTKEADLGLRRAKEGLTEIQVKNERLAADVAAANAAGVEGASNVVAARDKVATAVENEQKAQQRLSDAQRGVADAQRGITDASDNLADASRALAEAQSEAAAAGNEQSSSQAAAAEAMAKLSPAAQAFVTTLRGLKGAWDDLKGAVQESLFSGLADTVQELADKQLPTLKTGLAGIAGELNAGFRNSMAVFSQPQAVADFAVLLENVRLAWKNMADAAAPFTRIFIDLTTVGSEFLPQLSAGLGGAASKFAEFIGHLRETGKLHDIFQRALDVLGQVFSIVGNLGRGIGNIFAAALPAGGQLLTLLDTVTGTLATFLGSAEGQNSLSTFFDQIVGALTLLQPAFDALTQAAVVGLLPAISGLAAAIAPVVNTVLVQFADLITRLAPIIYPVLADAISAMLSALAPLIPIIAEMAEALFPVLADVLIILAPIVSAFAEAVGEGILNTFMLLLPAILPIVQAFAWLLEVITPYVPFLVTFAAGIYAMVLAYNAWTFATKMLKIAQDLLSKAMKLSPMGKILLIVGLVAAAFMALWANSETFRDIVKGALEVVGNAATWLWENAIKPAWDAIKVAWDVLAAGISYAWTTWIKPAWDAIAAAATWLFENVLTPYFNALLFVWGLIATGIGWYWNNVLKPVWDVIATVAQWLFNTILAPIFNAILWAFQALVTGISWAWDNILSPVFNVIMTIAEVLFKILVVVVFGAIMLAWTALTEGMKWAWENILKPVWEAIQTAAGWLWDHALKPIFDAMKVGWDLLLAGFDWAWKNILKPVWDAIKAAAGWLWDHALKPIFDAIGEGWSLLMDGFGWVYDHVLKPVFDAFATAAGGLKSVFETVVAAIKTAWDTVMDILSTPVNFVIEMIFNRGLFKAWNWAVDSLGLPDSWAAPHWDQLDHGVHFADGGTIPGSSPHPRADNIPIMATAGEFMQPVSAHQMYGTGFMEAVRTGLFPVELAQGFADGGPIWKTLDKKRKEWFPGSVLTSDVRPGDPGYHGRGMAIDIGWAGNNQAKLDDIGRRLVKLAPGSAEIIHNPTASVKNGKVVPSSRWGASTWREHLNHIHWAISNLAQLKGVASDGTDMSKEDEGSIFSRLLDSITAPIRDLAAKFGGDGFMGLIGEIPKGLLGKMWTGAVDKVRAFFSDLLPWNWGDDDSPDGLKDQAREALKGMGWGGGASWNALNQLVSHESSWNPKAQNRSSTASGLFQMIDGTWRSYRGDSDAKHMKDADPGDQIDAGLRYIKDRYLTPVGAWDFWSGHKYYDRGGYLPPGMTTVMNATGRPEPVLTASEHDSLLRWRGFEKGGPSAPSTVAGFVNNGTVLTTDLDELARKSRRGTQRALMAAGL